jgi:hypothetical protein
MTGDPRVTDGLVHDIVDALERHGYYRHDERHTRQAIGMIADLARVYDGTWQLTHSSDPGPVPPWPPEPGPPVPDADRDAVLLAGAEVSTVFAALDLAADHHRDRAAACAGCPDQSCPACQNRLQAARACERLAGRILDPGRADPAADREAGQ